MAAVLLVLAPEFGGLAFGPFTAGGVRLGSDPAQCTITLHPSLGVRPLHAQLSVQADGRALLQPVEVGAMVYVFSGGGRGAEVRGHATLSPGDAFSLASPTGPRFTLTLDQTAAAPPPGARLPRGAERLSAGSLAAEARRQAGAAAHLGPLASLSTFGYRLKSGALTQPRVVVGLIFGLGGLLVTGCGGLVAAVAALLHHTP